MRSSRRNNVGELIALAKAEAGRDHLRHVRRRLGRHVNIALLESMAGVKLAARALSRRSARAQRRHRRSYRAHVGQRELGVAAVARRQVKILGIGSAKRLPAFRRCRRWRRACRATKRSPGSGCSRTAGTPRDVVLKINAEVQQLFSDAAFRERFVDAAAVRVDDDSSGTVRRLHHRRDARSGQGDPRRQSQGRLRARPISSTSHRVRRTISHSAHRRWMTVATRLRYPRLAMLTPAEQAPRSARRPARRGMRLPPSSTRCASSTPATNASCAPPSPSG